MNEAGRLFPDPFLCFKKALFEVEASDQHESPRLGHTKKTIKFRRYTGISRGYTQFCFFLEKGLGLVCPHFVYDFSRKILLTLYSIN